ncbi:hypothetical protein PYCCODRAFT_1112212 [Trametes coccinea BRFM310]|uniref:Uncharacterized protein n=1 Tax=Trametes coccinea (strain BRFM310) TaxID=1353009 RepID=A0A1Y2I9B9_TRAC3|nr:hypothetical protein PYCCODRAFT_1112212 [Trametes coccinea BRFM310]
MDQLSPTTRFRTGYLITNAACRRYHERGMKKSFKGIQPDPQFSLHRRPNESEEQWQRRYDSIRHSYECEMSGIYSGLFLYVHNKASPEIRTQLVIPHLMHRVERCPSHGVCMRKVCFVPTGRGSPNEPESDLDRDRLQLFIQGYNTLIRDPERRASAGLTEADFTFVRLPESEIFRPTFWNNKVREMRTADRAAWDLYGLSRPEFAYMYLRR